MKTLTIKQPWASAIIELGKNIENRSWRTTYRGMILIHAGLGWDNEGEIWIRKQGLASPDFFENCRKNSGKIIGIVELSDIKKMAEIKENIWARGPFCWIISEVISIQSPKKSRASFLSGIMSNNPKKFS